MRIRRSGLLLSASLVVAIVVAAIWWRFDSDITAARTRAAKASVMVATRCGPIEYQEAGLGVPLLIVHGSGGGHDQGMLFAAPLARDVDEAKTAARYENGALFLDLPKKANGSGKRVAIG